MAVLRASSQDSRRTEVPREELPACTRHAGSLSQISSWSSTLGCQVSAVAQGATPSGLLSPGLCLETRRRGQCQESSFWPLSRK